MRDHALDEAVGSRLSPERTEVNDRRGPVLMRRRSERRYPEPRGGQGAVAAAGHPRRIPQDLSSASRVATCLLNTGLSWERTRPKSYAFNRLTAASETTFGATGGRDGFKISPRASISTMASG
jgi:hypothetical protein